MIHTFKEKTRYNTYIVFTFNEEDKCWDIDCHDAAYVSWHLDPNDNNTILGIDPEGFYIVSVGSCIPNTSDVISKIELDDTKNVYKAYIEN